uniref:Prokineticin 2 n=1 Tax=Molossus molossus TaxID=27622 RepID=A0A7J8DCX7_MOLMO|nr:prokineticin 2 [Molossus molossus]
MREPLTHSDRTILSMRVHGADGTAPRRDSVSAAEYCPSPRAEEQEALPVAHTPPSSCVPLSVLSIISLALPEPFWKWEAGKKKEEEKKKEKGGSILWAENASHMPMCARLSLRPGLLQPICVFSPKVITSE